MNLTGKLNTGILLATLTAGSAMAQIPNIVQHVQDKMNGVQQQNKAASDAALQGNSAAKAPAGKPAATVAKASAPANAKPAAAAPQQKASTAKASAPAAAKPAAFAPVTAKAAAPAKQDPFAKVAAPKASAKPARPVAVAVKASPKAGEAKTVPAKSANAKPADAKTADIKNADAKADAKDEPSDQKKEGFITAGNRRDPFVSPIVQHLGGSGCSTGKRCLAIDQIALRGIVKSDAGMIAVVVNSLDKAYFLRENDPVFNGYVLKISGDSVVFKETVQDKLGHLSTREVTKKITTPAV